MIQFFCSEASTDNNAAIFLAFVDRIEIENASVDLGDPPNSLTFDDCIVEAWISHALI